jgi:hypothetical protein
MINKNQNPMPTVTFEGKIYKLRSKKTVVPDFNTMDHLSVLLWLNRNTTAKGYRKAANPLTGLGNAISIKHI